MNEFKIYKNAMTLLKMVLSVQSLHLQHKLSETDKKTSRYAE